MLREAGLHAESANTTRQGHCHERERERQHEHTRAGEDLPRQRAIEIANLQQKGSQLGGTVQINQDELQQPFSKNGSITTTPQHHSTTTDRQHTRQTALQQHCLQRSARATHPPTQCHE